MLDLSLSYITYVSNENILFKTFGVKSHVTETKMILFLIFGCYLPTTYFSIQVYSTKKITLLLLNGGKRKMKQYGKVSVKMSFTSVLDRLSETG